MTWESAAAVGPQYIGYRVDQLGIVYFRYHTGGTIAYVMGRKIQIENIYDSSEDWKPFTANSLYPAKLKEIQAANERAAPWNSGNADQSSY
jgi:hypothetical protein